MCQLDLSNRDNFGMHIAQNIDKRFYQLDNYQTNIQSMIYSKVQMYRNFTHFDLFLLSNSPFFNYFLIFTYKIGNLLDFMF